MVHHRLIFDEKMQIKSSLSAEAARAGLGRKKGWFQRVFVGVVPQRGKPGHFAFVETVMKRVGFGNLYRKKVVDLDTGEIIRDCEEPLIEHQGRGSAKFLVKKQ